jgi:hypothetical protein
MSDQDFMYAQLKQREILRQQELDARDRQHLQGHSTDFERQPDHAPAAQRAAARYPSLFRYLLRLLPG